MHRSIYNKCNHLIKPIYINIVKPYSFGYGKYGADTLHKVSNVEHATHCYIIMDRVLGRRAENGSPNMHTEKKLEWLLGTHTKYRPLHFLPPYMFFGAIQKPGVISLDLLDGSTITDFPIEILNYCTIEGRGFDVMKHMMMSFFIIAAAGFAPRDIEYVLDGNKNDALMSIIDFNEVKTWNQRATAASIPYDINIDLAHIYIDLCGLRKTSSPNPMAPYDSPTPQWKFLCNPIVCPGGFFKAIAEIYEILPVEDYPYDFMKVVEHIVDYVEIFWLHPMKCPWKPTQPVFTNLMNFKQFDYRFQRHIISNLWSLNPTDYDDITKDIPYNVILDHILKGISQRHIPLNTEDDVEWGSMSLFS